MTVVVVDVVVFIPCALRFVGRESNTFDNNNHETRVGGVNRKEIHAGSVQNRGWRYCCSLCEHASAMEKAKRTLRCILSVYYPDTTTGLFPTNQALTRSFRPSFSPWAAHTSLAHPGRSKAPCEYNSDQPTDNQRQVYHRVRARTVSSQSAFFSCHATDDGDDVGRKRRERRRRTGVS